MRFARWGADTAAVMKARKVAPPWDEKGSKPHAAGRGAVEVEAVSACGRAREA
jgi:hypothetical protein